MFRRITDKSAQEINRSMIIQVEWPSIELDMLREDRFLPAGQMVLHPWGRGIECRYQFKHLRRIAEIDNAERDAFRGSAMTIDS